MLATRVANCSMLKSLQMDTNYLENAISFKSLGNLKEP